MSFWPQDWSAILVPDAPLAELIVRGTVIYFFLYVLMRMAGRRLLSKLAMSDILVVLLLAVAVREGITGPYSSVGDAAISGGVILGWNLLIDWLAFRLPWLRGPLRHRPTKIIEDGRILIDNARDHLLTRTEIMEQLRGHGLDSIDEVKEAYLEPNGTFSVVPG